MVCVPHIGDPAMKVGESSCAIPLSGLHCPVGGTVCISPAEMKERLLSWEDVMGGERPGAEGSREGEAPGSGGEAPGSGGEVPGSGG